MAVKTANELRERLGALPMPRNIRSLNLWKGLLGDLIDTIAGEETPAPEPAAPAPVSQQQEPPADDFFDGLDV